MSIDIIYAFQNAARAGDMDEMRALCEKHPSWVNIVDILEIAASNGDIEMLLYLLPLVTDPKHRNNAIREAATYGQLEAVEFLLPYVPDKGRLAFAVTNAAAKGHLEVVKLLSDKVDLKVLVLAMKHANQNGHADVAEYLQDKINSMTQSAEVGASGDSQPVKPTESNTLEASQPAKPTESQTSGASQPMKPTESKTPAPSLPRGYAFTGEFEKALRENNIANVKALLKAHPEGITNIEILNIPAWQNDIPMLEFLLPQIRNYVHIDIAFILAVTNGQLDAVKLLLPHVRGQQTVSVGMNKAAVNGHIQVLEYLENKIYYGRSQSIESWASENNQDKLLAGLKEAWEKGDSDVIVAILHKNPSLKYELAKYAVPQHAAEVQTKLPNLRDYNSRFGPIKGLPDLVKYAEAGDVKSLQELYVNIKKQQRSNLPSPDPHGMPTIMMYEDGVISSCLIALEEAIINNRIGVVEFLLPITQSESIEEGNYQEGKYKELIGYHFHKLVMNDDATNMLNALLTQVGPGVINKAMITAVEKGHTKTVNVLLNRIVGEATLRWPFLLSVLNENLPVMSQILPKIKDPKILSDGLKLSALYNNKSMIEEFLFGVKDKEALEKAISISLSDVKSGGDNADIKEFLRASIEDIKKLEDECHVAIQEGDIALILPKIKGTAMIYEMLLDTIKLGQRPAFDSLLSEVSDPVRLTEILKYAIRENKSLYLEPLLNKITNDDHLLDALQTVFESDRLEISSAIISKINNKNQLGTIIVDNIKKKGGLEITKMLFPQLTNPEDLIPVISDAIITKKIQIRDVLNSGIDDNAFLGKVASTVLKHYVKHNYDKRSIEEIVQDIENQEIIDSILWPLLETRYQDLFVKLLIKLDSSLDKSSVVKYISNVQIPLPEAQAGSPDKKVLSDLNSLVDMYSKRDDRFMIISLLPKMNQEQVKRAMINAVKNGSKEMVNVLLPRVTDPVALHSSFLLSIWLGNLHITQRLLPEIKDSKTIDDGLQISAVHNYKEITEALLPKVENKEALWEAMVEAAERQSTETFQYLLGEIGNPETLYDAFLFAVESKKLNALKALRDSVGDLELFRYGHSISEDPHIKDFLWQSIKYIKDIELQFNKAIDKNDIASLIKILPLVKNQDTLSAGFNKAIKGRNEAALSAFIRRDIGFDKDNLVNNYPMLSCIFRVGVPMLVEKYFNLFEKNYFRLDHKSDPYAAILSAPKDIYSMMNNVRNFDFSSPYAANSFLGSGEPNLRGGGKSQLNAPNIIVMSALAACIGSMFSAGAKWYSAKNKKPIEARALEDLPEGKDIENSLLSGYKDEIINSLKKVSHDTDLSIRIGNLDKDTQLELVKELEPEIITLAAKNVGYNISKIISYFPEEVRFEYFKDLVIDSMKKMDIGKIQKMLQTFTGEEKIELYKKWKEFKTHVEKAVRQEDVDIEI